LTYRDVQQILALAARHFDFADPGLQTNGAGYLISHNVGFGVPEAAQAVALALRWSSRPQQEQFTFTATNTIAVPDDGLRVLISGPGVPEDLTSIGTLPSTGPHADTPTPALPLADFGYGTNLAGYNLTNHGALIQRGAATFAAAITSAAQAGAAFAVVYNYPGDPPGGDQLVPMGATDFVPIPAVFIGHTAGERLKQLFLTNQTALAQIHLESTNFTFAVTNSVLCEQVGLRVLSDHPLRGDLRITLVSPSGTRSVLQQYNADTSPGPVDWTYHSTQHFFENSAGTWTAWFSDEGEGNTGSVQSVSLVIRGVTIQDQDRDGLDDTWEVGWFNTLAQYAAGDPDQDGYSNSREQLMGTNPKVANHLPFALDLSRWNPALGRLSWPSRPGAAYEILAGADPVNLSTITNVSGTFSETEWFGPMTNGARFYRVRELGNGGIE
ncbi:MAG TPA: proprotein convertase P-domain-containing protein, partial [Clostridia bacterium]|nr:proprotein convertase P-domain-containing protein [Clostridia bacterium]